MDNNLPFERSYWVIPARLLAGCYPGSKDPAETEKNMKALLESGIRSIINLMEPDETDHSEKPFKSYDGIFKNLAKEMGLDISWTRVPIPDLNVPSPETMRQILDLIDASLNDGKPVYIHCWGGRGRTGTVVGCYLVRNEGMSGEDALQKIKRLRTNEPTAHKPSPETRAQCDMVRNWTEAPKPAPANEFIKGDTIKILSGKHIGQYGTIQNFYAPRGIYRVKLDGNGKVVPQKPDKIIRIEQPISLLDRYLGCLVGLAVGDAVGTALEFKRPGSFKPITDMVGGGPFRLKPGQWTDDTSMALCLAASLIEKKNFDPKDQMERYVKWYKEGYMSSNGVCFDIGNATRSALMNFQKTGNPFSGSTGEHSAGNGSLMRLAPLPLFYANDPTQAIRMSGESSKTTHAHPACVDACRYFAGLIVGALQGASKEKILSEKYCPVEGYWTQNRLHPEILPIADGDYKRKQPPQINGKGHVVRTLEAALWAFYSTESFEEGCLKVVNLGDDADTTGAVYGQIAGAFYGYDSIPVKWRDKLAKRDLLEETAKSLFRAANGGQAGGSIMPKKSKGQTKKQYPMTAERARELPKVPLKGDPVLAKLAEKFLTEEEIRGALEAGRKHHQDLVERMGKQQSEEFGLENVFKDNYLGSPDVVAKVIQDYIDKLYENIKKRGAGTLSSDDFKADLRKWAKEFSDIFLGRNPDYIKVVGWNSPYALGIAIKQVLEGEWERRKDEYNNDPGQLLFGYLATRLVDACSQALKDPDAAGMKFDKKKEMIIKFLLGLGKRK